MAILPWYTSPAAPSVRPYAENKQTCQRKVGRRRDNVVYTLPACLAGYTGSRVDAGKIGAAWDI